MTKCTLPTVITPIQLYELRVRNTTFQKVTIL